MGHIFFSINGTRELELLCINSMENAQIRLSGLGSIKIKANCYAKFNKLLLTGSNTFKLNKTYTISRLSQKYLNMNFTLLSTDTIKNISLNEMNLANLETNLTNNNYYYHYHLSIIYIILIFCTFISILTIFVHYKKKNSLDRISQEKVASTNSLGDSTNDKNNDIPAHALKLAKKAKKKSNHSN